MFKGSEERIADEYESSSILFADVAGFTPMSAEMTPTELVSLLDDVFTDFGWREFSGGVQTDSPIVADRATMVGTDGGLR